MSVQQPSVLGISTADDRKLSRTRVSIQQVLRTSLIAACLVLTCLTLGGGRGDNDGDSSDGTTKYETPEAVFGEMKEAMTNNDMARFVEVLTPEGANLFVGNAIHGANRKAERLGKSEEDKPKAEAILAVLKKHRVAPEDLEQELPEQIGSGEERDRAIGALVTNKKAFISELFRVFDEGVRNFPQEVELIDVKIEGDRATARMVLNTERGKQYDPFWFRKIDGGWLIDAPQRESRQPDKPVAELQQKSTVCTIRLVL